MNTLFRLLAKARKKGLRACLRIFRERYLYCHWELLTLQRQLDLPTPARHASTRRSIIPRIELSHMPIFERHFTHYRRAIDTLLKQGLHGTACCDEEGNAIAMLWASERDYYDDQLYRCWVRLPPGCIYQFAGEVAQPYRGGGSGIALTVQRTLWDQYRQRGFQASRGLVDINNRASLRLFLHLGFEEIGEAMHVYRLFGCLYYNRTVPYHTPRLLHLYKKKAAVGLTMQESAP